MLSAKDTAMDKMGTAFILMELMVQENLLEIQTAKKGVCHDREMLRNSEYTVGDLIWSMGQSQGGLLAEVIFEL